MRRGSLAWGLAGFLLGAVFWHLIGFWDFLGAIVTKRDHQPTAIERILSSDLVSAEAPLALADHERHARTAAQNCTTLMRDGTTGRTVARPCIVIVRNVLGDAEATATQRPLATAGRLDRWADGR